MKMKIMRPGQVLPALTAAALSVQPVEAGAKLVPTFQLLQFKAAIRLEAVGMKHSSGRSVRKYACQRLGLPIDTTHQDVISAIQDELNARTAEVLIRDGGKA